MADGSAQLERMKTFDEVNSLAEKYAYQPVVINDAVNWLEQAQAGDRLCYTSPTGTGKSFVELGILDKIPRGVLIAPKHEIIDGYLMKLGIKHPETISEMSKFQLGFATPITLRNRLADGLFEPPNYLLIDEVHHFMAASYGELWSLCGGCPIIGLTATAYGGTPNRTRLFREFFGGNIKVIMTYPEAAAKGLISFPEVITYPLLDDDEVEVKNGDFEVTSVVNKLKTQLVHIGDILKGDFKQSRYTHSIIIAFPQVELTKTFTSVIGKVLGLPIDYITSATPISERRQLLRECRDKKTALCQVNTIGEGIDFEFDMLIDLAPTMSPVKWCQLLGRIMRPGLSSTYICTNRNVLRHGYLMAGLLPAETLLKAQIAFPVMTRLGSRAVGLEGLGRFKPIMVEFLDGLRGLMYSLSALEGFERVDYVAIQHPMLADIIWATKRSERSKNGKLEWGRWNRLKTPPVSLKGFNSLDPTPVTSPQLEWWLGAAEEWGLDPAADVNRKNFQILPVLTDIGLKFLGRRKS